MPRPTSLSEGKTSNPQEVVTFTQRADGSSDWHAIGDPIMDGCSEGELWIMEEGVGEFRGTVRSDNGGGFASIKRDLPLPVDASGFEGVELLAKGDGRTYKIGLRQQHRF